MGESTLEVDLEIKRREVLDKLAQERRVSRKVIRENTDLRSRLDAFLDVSEIKIKRPRRFKTSKGKKAHTQVGLISDTHTYEVIDPDRVGNRNMHNAEIGKARLEKLFYDTAQKYKMFSKFYSIGELVVCLMGDYLVNNELHPPDSNEAVHASPLTEMQGILPILKGGIEYLAKQTGAHIHVPCVFGNHGRSGKIKRITGQADYSLEHFMHVDIANHFADNERVSVDARPIKGKIVNIGGVNVYVHHGDPLIKGGAGLAGSFERAFKKVSENDPEIDLLVTGHVHQSGYFVRRGFSNGCLCGYNEYAAEFALLIERPQQWGFLVSHEDKAVGTVWPYWGD